MAILAKFKGHYYQLVESQIPDDPCRLCYFYEICYDCIGDGHPSCTKACSISNIKFNHMWEPYHKMVKKGDKIIKL